MRDIKFRAKRVDNKEWIFGYYVLTPNSQHRIYWQPFADATSNTYHIVIPETVGQYIGISDTNNTEIYEGDVISVDVLSAEEGTTIENDNETTFLVAPQDDYILAEVKYHHSGFVACTTDDDGQEFYTDIEHDTLVVDNIHDKDN